MARTSTLISALALSGALLAACSGGGSGSPPPPPPPPPVNSAPTAVLTASSTTVDEGQSLTLDASGSSDADGDTLSFSWSQVSGPAATITPTGNTATIQASEVTTDGAMVFRATVSDGTATSTSDVTISAVNIVLTPASTVLGPAAAKLSGLDNPHHAFLTLSLGFGSQLALSTITGNGNSSQLSFFDPPNAGVFGADKPTPIAEDASGNVSTTAGSYTNTTNTNLVYGFESEGIVRVYSSTGGSPAYSELSSISIPNVCALTTIFGDGFPLNLVVGQRNSGIRILLNRAYTGAPVEEWGQFVQGSQITSTGSYCHLFSGDNGTNIHGFNADDGLLHFWERQATSLYVEQPPIDFQIPNSLNLVGVTGQTNNRGFFLYAAIVSDGQHDGDHRLILLHNRFDGSGATTRLEYTWPKGIPSDLTIAGLTVAGEAPDILVSLNSAPFLAVVENAATAARGDIEPAFGSVMFAPTRLGATEIHERGTILYKDRGEIEFQHTLDLN